MAATTATAPLPYLPRPGRTPDPRRRGDPLPTPSSMAPADLVRRAAEIKARLLRAVRGLVEATRTQRSAVAEYRRALGQLQRRSSSLLHAMEPLPSILDDVGAKVSEIGAQARCPTARAQAGRRDPERREAMNPTDAPSLATVLAEAAGGRATRCAMGPLNL